MGSSPLEEDARTAQRRRKPAVPFFYPDWLVLRENASFVRDGLAAHARGRLLDVGCGEKPFESDASGVSEWIGVDVPQNARADVHAYADSLPFPDEAFDTVLCTEVLEHVPEARAAVREMARILRAGGCVILTTPLLYPLHEVPYDFSRLTPYALKRLFESEGFEILEQRRMATGPKAVATIANGILFHCAERLPGGKTLPGRAIVTPFYIFNNLVALLLSAFIKDEKSPVDQGLIARKLAD